MNRVVVLGIAVVDVIGYASRRPNPGETLVGTGYSISAGGKGLNQAVAAARAGAEVSLVGSVGSDVFGEMLLETIDREGVDRSPLAVVDEDPTGVGLPVVTADGENSIVVVPGASSRIGETHYRWIDQHVTSGTLFVSQLELDDSVVRPAIRAASDRGATVILNPAPARGIESLFKHVDVLVPNAVEACILSGLGDPRDAARHLAASHPTVEVVVTCGSDGALYVANGALVHVEAEAVEAVDTVGAGDVFCGYLAAELASGSGLGDAVVSAVSAATYSVQRPGAAESAPHRHGGPT